MNDKELRDVKERISELENDKETSKKFWKLFWNIFFHIVVVALIVIASLYEGKVQGRQKFINSERDNVCYFAADGPSCMTHEEFLQQLKKLKEDDTPTYEYQIPNTTSK